MRAAGVLIAAVVIAGIAQLATHRGPPAPPAAIALRTPPLVLGRSTPSAVAPAPDQVQSERAGDIAPVVHPAPSAATTSAHRFLTAYVSWEAGRTAEFDQTQLRKTSTPGLWATLSSGRGEPVPPPGLGAPRLVGLIAGPMAGRRTASVIASLRRVRRTVGLVMVLRHSHGVWRVAGLGR